MAQTDPVVAPYNAMSYASSLQISDASYRNVETSNFIALATIFKAKLDGASLSNGYIDLTGGTTDGAILALPFKRVSNTDITSIPSFGGGMLYCDSAGALTFKTSAGVLLPITMPTDYLRVPEVTTLPDPTSFPAGTTGMVMDVSGSASVLKIYDSKSSSWKNISIS